MGCESKPANFPDFYWQVLKNWFEVKALTIDYKNAFDIRRESLWLNKNIKVNNKELRGALWHNSGINLVHDILNNAGQFLTANEIETKFNIKCDILKYNTLKDAIPQMWRKILKQMKIPTEAINFNEITCLKINTKIKPINNIKNKDMYWIFVQNVQVIPIICEKIWNKLKLTTSEWKNIFTTPKVIRNTKIRAFQYKLLYNLIPCNAYLKKIKRSITDKCDTCQELDDITHYIYECHEVKTFWDSFARWWKNCSGEVVSINKKTVLVGITENKIKNQSLNACILFAKWHIYKNKLDNSSIFFYKYLCELKYILVIEQAIAMRNNKMNTYTNMWQKIEDHLT
jgi:hypothetical protein